MKRQVSILLTVATLLWGCAAQAAPFISFVDGHLIIQEPEAEEDPWASILPQLTVDTTLPTGWNGTADATPADSAALQTALDNAVQNGSAPYIIQLTAGNTYTGPFKVKKKTGSQWLIIRTSGYGSLPATGTRVTSASNMAKIRGTGAGAESCGLWHEWGAHHVRFIGIEFTTTYASTSGSVTLVHCGYDPYANAHYDNTDDEPHHIIFDRCYLHGTSTGSTRQALYFNGAYMGVVDCRFSDIHEVGADSQAILIHQGAGPYKIVNNYIEAAGENIMIGGADPRITNRVPADITIQGNYFFKPLSWKPDDPSYAEINWLIKNHFEIKNGERVLFEGNVCQNCWAYSQAGFSIVFTPRNQDGTADWSTCQDVTCRKNYIHNTAQGFQILSGDTLYPSQATTRVLVEGNVVECDMTANGGNGRQFQLSANPAQPAEYLTLRHNTLIHKTQAYTFLTIGDNPYFASTIRVLDNLSSHGLYGVHTPSGTGKAGMDIFLQSYSFLNNALIVDGEFVVTYPDTTLFPADVAACNFANYAGGDYTITSGILNNAATDGTDIGADISALNTTTAGVAP